MKGLLFYDHDSGDPPKGYHAHHQRWCVEIEGVKVHLFSSYIGTRGHADDPPRYEVGVATCDDSCTEIIDIPEQVWREAQERLKGVMST